MLVEKNGDSARAPVVLSVFFFISGRGDLPNAIMRVALKIWGNALVSKQVNTQQASD